MGRANATVRNRVADDATRCRFTDRNSARRLKMTVADLTLAAVADGLWAHSDTTRGTSFADGDPTRLGRNIVGPHTREAHGRTWINHDRTADRANLTSRQNNGEAGTAVASVGDGCQHQCQQSQAVGESFHDLAFLSGLSCCHSHLSFAPSGGCYRTRKRNLKKKRASLLTRVREGNGCCQPGQDYSP